MSNKNKPHHKFVQTFVLAEQPNGYFVLNDIFRYLNLNEEDDEIVEDEVLQPEVPAEEPVTPADPSVEPPTEELVTSETAVEEVNNKLEDEKALEEETSAPVNGTDADESVEEAAPLEEESAQPEPEAANEPTPEPAVEQTPEPEPTVVAPPKAPEPVAETQPAKPKTWASMLGGSKPAVPALPAQSQQKAPAQPKVQKPAAQAAASKATPTEPAAASPSPTPSNGWQTAESGKKGRGPSQPKQESNVLAYIKNVNEKVDARVLREVLEKYGELKYFDVSRMRVSDSALHSIVADFFRIAPSSNSPPQRAIMPPSLPIRTLSTPSPSLSKNAAQGLTPMVVATLPSVVAPTRTLAVAAAAAICNRGKAATPVPILRMLPVVACNSEALNPATSRPEAVDKARQYERSTGITLYTYYQP